MCDSEERESELGDLEMDPAAASEAWVAGGARWDGQGSPAGPEPSFKKARNDSQGVPGQRIIDYRDDGHVPYGRSTTGGGGGVQMEASQTHTSAGVQNYGMNYGMQQTPTYGLNLPDGSQNFGSQHLPAQNHHSTFPPASGKASGALFYKTKLCTNFKSGSCTFNERCVFAHGVEDLRKPAPGWESMVSAGGSTTRGNFGVSAMGGQQKKNRPCRYFVDGNCPYGDRCNFLHGNEEIVKTTSWDSSAGVRGFSASKQTYKTRLCANWEKGEPCSFGNKCHFAHGPEELQKHAGGSSYPNGGTTSDMQYLSSTLQMGAPNMHTDPSMMNPPPSAVSYGEVANYASSGGYGTASNSNPYTSMGPTVAPFASAEVAMNGTAANYNNWEGSAASRQPTGYSQGYVHASQVPWTVDYSANGGYPGRENETTASQYPQEQSQPQGPPFVTGGNVYEYQDPKQNVHSSYVHGHSQSMHQTSGGVGHYHGAYGEAMYTNQQEDYSTRYEMAEVWGVKN